MQGTVCVDFKGSREEFLAFIADHKSKFPHGLSKGRGSYGSEWSERGFPMLFARYNTLLQRKAVQATYEELGWTLTEQEIRPHVRRTVLLPGANKRH